MEPTVAQGDLRLLETELAKQLLDSRIPARYAFTGTDGKPRVVGSWFKWTGTELVMPTFISAPHIRHTPYRVRALRANPDVAITIDTETFPPQVLTIRGVAEVQEVDGVDSWLYEQQDVTIDVLTSVLVGQGVITLDELCSGSTEKRCARLGLR